MKKLIAILFATSFSASAAHVVTCSNLDASTQICASTNGYVVTCVDYPFQVICTGTDGATQIINK